VALFVIGGFAMDNSYRVVRAVEIKADPAKVHEMCGELKNWPKWAPWEASDPTVKTTYGDTTTGVGAHQSWTSDGGDGELTLTRCDPAAGITYSMNFIEGEQKIPAVGAMNYKPIDGGVQVEWTMEGKMEMALIGPYFALAADSMIGGMFQQGLDKLKTTCESAR
jgi:hypothetical protein